MVEDVLISIINITYFIFMIFSKMKMKMKMKQITTV